MDEFGLDKNDKFVDIHGREISTITIGPEEEPACLLSDLKQTGVAIFQKSQYVKLSSVKKEFDSDFMDYMLESAKSYMLANKCSFSHHQIMRSIEYCKQELDCEDTVKPQKKTFKGREIEEIGGDFVISVANPQSIPRPFKCSKAKSPNTKVSPKPVQNGDLESSFKNLELQVRPPKSRLSYNASQEVKPYQKTQQNDEASKPFRKFNYNVPQEEHEVLVTSIDKSNCIWVRDVANEELLEKIHHRINEEVEFQEMATKPWVMDKVYMAQDEGNWFRCKIVRISPLTVFFLDYGNVAEVNQLRNVSEELSNTPCLAVRITFRAQEYKPRLEDVIRIKRFHKNDDGTYFVNIMKKSSGPTTPLVHQSSFPESKPQKQATVEPVIVKKPQFFCELKHDQRVVIGYLKNDEFFLRTKECFEKDRDIENRVQTYGKTAQKIKVVKVGQVVLYEDPKEKKFYRVIVRKFVKTKVDVDFMDCGKEETVDLSALRTVDEELAREPLTFVNGGKLVGFESEPLPDNCKNFINNCIERRVKFSVVLGFDDELDLHDGTQLLSQQIQNLSPKRIFLKDMKTFKPETGIKAYVCGTYKEPENLTLVPSDLLTEHVNTIFMSNVDSTPYPPVNGEVCRCYYIDYWYRCVVTRIFDKECEVLLLDFGNVELVEKKNLRKAEEGITDVPALAIPCILIGLPNHNEVKTLLRKKIIDGDVYSADVKKIEGGKCHVELPKVYEEIRKVL